MIASSKNTAEFVPLFARSGADAIKSRFPSLWWEALRVGQQQSSGASSSSTSPQPTPRSTNFDSNRHGAS
jgi:hypothetical protein